MPVVIHRPAAKQVVEVKAEPKKEFPKAKVVPKLGELDTAIPVNLKKKNFTPSGKRKYKDSIVTREQELSRDQIRESIDRAIAAGEIVPKSCSRSSISDPEFREQFGRLLYMGATKTMICMTLGIDQETYRVLKRQFLESIVESLGETGVIGMVALSFDKLEFSSKKVLQLIATMSEGDIKEADRADLISAIRTLKDIENDKVTLLVKTGAIKPKKKVEFSGHMELLTGGTQQLLTAEKAQGTIVKLLSKVTEAAEDEDGEEEAD